MIEELKNRVKQLKKELMKWELIFDLSTKEKEIEKLEKQMSKNSFWSDQEKAQKVIKRVKELKNVVSEFNKLKTDLEELVILLELNTEEDRREIWEEIEQKIKALENDLEKKELIVLFDSKYDANNAIVTIRPGAGGTESQDWAEILLRMYLRWAEKRRLSIKIIEISPGEEAGIKNVTFIVSGNYAFGYLKAEKGIHRLVRISPFDANRRRHTSFASVEVIPEIDQDVDIDIKESDLRIDTYRATGAGGQHVNTTDSAVRITHLPTNIVVQCQNERSQYSNKMTAMKILRARLFEYYQREKEEDLKKISGKKKKIAWGSQIRSYVFHPYQMVKDHRTDVESGNVQAIMDGEIDCFIEAYLKSKNKH
ncbi:MAG TPA: peptide chain release factor 2 [Candidatus Atribacteria bacterium]|nr:peptide chain release factor 2 [Candidatus Atribacteria bacterium]